MYEFIIIIIIRRFNHLSGFRFHFCSASAPALARPLSATTAGAERRNVFLDNKAAFPPALAYGVFHVFIIRVCVRVSPFLHAYTYINAAAAAMVVMVTAGNLNGGFAIGPGPATAAVAIKR